MAGDDQMNDTMSKFSILKLLFSLENRNLPIGNILVYVLKILIKPLDCLRVVEVP